MIKDILNRSLGKVKIEKFNLKDINILFDFYDKAWDDPKFFKERWYWQYIQNPGISENQALIWVFIKDDRIAGQIASMPVEIKIDGKYHDALWLTDLKVLPDYEKLGIGLFLLNEVENERKMLLGLGISDKSYNIFKNFDYSPNMLLPCYIREIQPFKKKSTESTTLSCTVVDKFTSEHEQFFNNISSSYKIICRKDRKFLEWRYQSYDYLKHCVVQAKEGSSLRGLIFLRVQGEVQGGLGTVTDILTKPEDEHTFDILMQEAFSYFLEQKISKIRCYMIDRRIGSHLLRNGFKETSSKMRFMYKNNDPGIENSILSQSGSWYLTMADSDIGTLRW